jgi:hexosaminidase
VQDIVISLGKKPVGWDEISLARLRPGAIAQYWSSAENANKAVAQGAKLIMSPASRVYIDMKYDSTTVIGYTWAGLTEVDKAYNWDPATLEPGIGRDNILGIEAALWTETVTNMEEIEFLTFPRLPGIAEVAWTQSSLRNWDEYKLRLGNHAKRFKAMGINYYPSKLVPWAE